MTQTFQKKSVFSVVFLLCGTVAVLLGGLSPAWSQTKVTETWHFTWDAPAYGSPPVHYVVEIRIDGTTVEEDRTAGSTPEIDIEVTLGLDYEVRVAGVDAQGRQGPFSPWSFRDTAELSAPRR